MAAAEAVEGLLAEIWRRRREEGTISALTDRLIELVSDAAALDATEFHMPQFAHMIIHISSDCPAVAELERFVLAVCQISVHLALQFFWIVYAALQESAPKRKGDKRVYTRCARLLLNLEQCVVYGYGSSEGGSSVSMQELMKHCVAAAVSSTSENADEVAFSGTLMKKGGGTSKVVGRRNWNARYLEVRSRVLYYYAPASSRPHDGAANGSAAGRKPLGSMALSTAEVDSSVGHPKGKKAHYFEVRCRQSGQVMKLAARNADDRAMWIHVRSIA